MLLKYLQERKRKKDLKILARAHLTKPYILLLISALKTLALHNDENILILNSASRCMRLPTHTKLVESAINTVPKE